MLSRSRSRVSSFSRASRSLRAASHSSRETIVGRLTVTSFRRGRRDRAGGRPPRRGRRATSARRQGRASAASSTGTPATCAITVIQAQTRRTAGFIAPVSRSGRASAGRALVCATQNTAPAGSTSGPMRPYGCRTAARAPGRRSPRAAVGRRVGVRDVEVHEPVRRRALRRAEHPAHAAERGRVAGQVEGRVVRPGRLERLEVVAEDAAVEGPRRIRVGRAQVLPGQAAGLVDQRRADVLAGGPDAEHAPRRVARDEHAAQRPTSIGAMITVPPCSATSAAVRSASSLAT